MEGPAAGRSVREPAFSNGENPFADKGSVPFSNRKTWLRVLPTTQPAMEAEPPTPVYRELAALFLLLLLAAGIRAWLISHTEVAARDSIGFIRYALELERYPWKEVLQRNLQHPGYPLVLLAVSWPVRQLLGGMNYVSMQLSAQLASALAGVLLVLPMYYLGRELFGRRAGFWGTALFQCLPVSARVMSDALSEATFLFFTAAALLFAVRAVRQQSAARFAGCGFFCGLAYLTRPEGALILVATSVVLLAMQLSSAWRCSWPRLSACMAALLFAALAISSPYVLVIGRLTNKPTPRIVLETAALEETWRSRLAEEPHRPTVWRGPLTASLLAIYAPGNLKDRRLWGLQAIATEMTKDLHYLSVLPLLLGLWWFRDRLRTVRGTWVLLVFCALHSFILWRLGVMVGYVSDRHVLVLVLCGVFIAAGGVFALAELIIGFANHLRAGPLLSPQQTADRSSRLAVVLLVALLGFGLQEALKPLHGNRAGHRQAGLWLAEHTQPADPVIDPFCWAHYYAGRVFWEGLTPPTPPGYIPTQYVVLERSPTSEHSRLPTIHQAEALARHGQVVYHWPVEKADAEAKILIYAVQP